MAEEINLFPEKQEIKLGKLIAILTKLRKRYTQDAIVRFDAGYNNVTVGIEEKK